VRGGAAIHWLGREDYELPAALRCLCVASWSRVHRTQLYLPKEWTHDPDRLEAAYVPVDIGFATQPKLASRMIAGAIATSVPFKRSQQNGNRVPFKVSIVAGLNLPRILQVTKLGYAVIPFCSGANQVFSFERRLGLFQEF